MSNDENKWPSPEETSDRPATPPTDPRTAEHVWAPPHGGGYSGSAYTAPPAPTGPATGQYQPPPPPYGGAPATYGQPERPKAKKGRVLPWLSVILVSALMGGTVAAVIDNNGDKQKASSTALTLAPATASNAAATPSSIRSVLERVQPAVVSIQTRTRQGGGSGTGMIITSDGEILTNAHVVQGAEQIFVTLNDETSPRPADLLGADLSIDSAVIKLRDASNLPTVTFGNASSAQVGDQVVAIGNALALPGGPTVTTGIISGKDRTTPDATGTGQLDNLIQTDAAINPGNSGGPLTNLAGEIIGMNTEVIRGANGEYENIGFALSVNTVQPAIADLRAGRVVERPYLGVSTVSVTSDIKERFDLTPEQGAVVSSVSEGSPADAGGLNAYDVITAVDGKSIEDASALVNAIRTKRVGDQVKVDYYRGGERRSAEVTLAARPTMNLAG